MPEQCSCGHGGGDHPTQMSSGNPATGMPPWPSRPCVTPGCSCGEYQEDRGAVTDSERLIRIEDMLNRVLQKLDGKR
jgi:hypothetical protein